MGLVIGRKPGEGLVIIAPTGEQIFVEVVKGENGLLRLNIEAPQEYKLLRSELVNGGMDVTD